MHKYAVVLSMELKAAIIGASGYSGKELTKILRDHPQIGELALIANTTVGERTKVLARKGRSVSTHFQKLEDVDLASCDVVFLALHSGAALEMLSKNEIALNDKAVLVDLGGDFRLRDLAAYEKYYGRTHTALSQLQGAVYGLSELNRAAVAQSKFISNPGCYPTSAILPLVPLLKEGVIESDIIINSMSGVSGAGKKAAVEFSFVEINETVKAYKVGDHQHLPEIAQALKDFSGVDTEITFTPHLIPITRGIYTTIYADVKPGVTSEKLDGIFKEYYQNEPFVQYGYNQIPEIKNVIGTNAIEIGFRLNERTGKLTVLSTIDNLLKGAAGQAVQNMNIACGFEEVEGLL